MSERGSFVTEFIYCKKCLEAAQSVLLPEPSKGLAAVQVPIPMDNGGGLYPIIAGKVGGLYSGEELHTFDIEMRERLEPLLCHNLRIAVLAEQGQEVFTFEGTAPNA